jgi:peptide/nickel transport system substrate-binding protein
MRMILIRPILLAILALTSVMAFAACSDDEPTATRGPEATATATTPAATSTPTLTPGTPTPTATAAPLLPTATPTATPMPTPTPILITRGGILRVGHRKDPPAAWDTMRSTNYNLTPLTAAIAGEGNLVQPCWDDETTICPAIAESWDVNSDFTSYTFKIRDGVKWHDGEPLTAEDVVYWVNLFVNGAKVGDLERLPGVAKAQFGDFKSVELLAGNSMRINLNNPDAFYLDGLAMHRVPIFHPQHLFDPAIQAGNMDVTPLELGNIAAGPFKFVSYEPGIGVVTERNDEYWEKDGVGNQLPFLDGVEYFILPDASAYHAAFRTGRLDRGAMGRGYYVAPSMVPQYRESLGDDVYFLERAGGASSGLGFNTLKAPFSDIRLREAISLWIDRQTAIDTLNQGAGKIRAGFLDPNSSDPAYLTWPGYNTDTREADRARAKQLVADAGAEGLEFTIILPNTMGTAMEWWAGAIDGLGITAKLQVMDVTAFDERKAGTDWDATWTGGNMDQGTTALINFSFGQKADSPYAGTVHDDPKIAEEATRLGSVRSNAERNQILRELEKYIFLDKAYILQASVGVDLVPVRSYVKDTKMSFILNPPTFASFSRTWIQK